MFGWELVVVLKSVINVVVRTVNHHLVFGLPCSVLWQVLSFDNSAIDLQSFV